MITRIIFSTFTLLSLSSFANEITVKMSLSPIGSFEAKTQKLRGEVSKNGDTYTAQAIWVKIDDLKTEIDLRDKHFHEYLNNDKYPKITMTNVVAKGGNATGTLTVNSIPKKVDFTYKAITDKKIEARLKVKPSSFNLKRVKYLDIGVEDEVEIVVSMDVK